MEARNDLVSHFKQVDAGGEILVCQRINIFPDSGVLRIGTRNAKRFAGGYRNGIGVVVIIQVHSAIDTHSAFQPLRLHKRQISIKMAFTTAA
ncbi:hypothetical protein VH86_14995 [Pantoea sp. BL1]|nr:hypothetical protein VH86_14995 [Pantoea sp. BL1]